MEASFDFFDFFAFGCSTGQVEQARRHIADLLLTLQCPRCSAAFLDFDGCFALTCSRCVCGFCAWCLQDCGNDAHQHVATCQFNSARRGVHGSRAEFAKVQTQRRQRIVEEYLQTLAPALREKVVALCAQDFADLRVAITI